MNPTRTFALTVITLVAFAANSVLCRVALRDGSIDAATFMTIRLVSGAVALFPFAWRVPSHARPPWRAALALILYAVAFTYAYVTLPAGTGALLLFGSVQATMIGTGLINGEHPRPLEWCGLVLGAAGLVWLVAPGVSAPPPFGAALMIGAGMMWGAYSLFGRGSTAPAAATAWNFLRVAPFALLVELAAGVTGAVHATWSGAVLATVSGALTSGLGYIAWYSALKDLTATRASIVQLMVPVIAAMAGVAFLDEPATLRLLTAGALILGGVALAVTTRARA